MLEKEFNRMNAYKIETILSEDGILTLKGLPFHAGDAVEVIILERSPSVSTEESSSQLENAVLEQPQPNLYPLRGTVHYSYEDPFEPAVPIEDWEVLQ
jgi:hypothetical protein